MTEDNNIDDNSLHFYCNDLWEHNTMKTVIDTVGMYPPYSESGAIDIKYKKAVKSKSEGKTTYHDKFIKGIAITIVLDFNNIVEISDTDMKG